MSKMTPDKLAQACANSMLQDDKTTQAQGMRIESVTAGLATLSMPVRADMTNGHSTCHGGFIFMLADSAFAFACNGYNQRAVAQHCSITYLAPAHAGDILTATATEISREGRSGLYDVRVVNQDGQPIAEFRGHSRTVKGVHLPVQS